MINVADYALTARVTLFRGIAWIITRAARLDEITLRENVAGWERLKLYYRVLAGVERTANWRQRSWASAFRCRLRSRPRRFINSRATRERSRPREQPASCRHALYSQLALEHGDGIGFCPEAASPRWFQLYVYNDREITLDLVDAPEAAGAEAIVLTVDALGLGTRERDTRNNFRLPDGLAVQNLTPLGKGNFPRVTGSGLAAYVRDNFKQDLGFDDLEWLCGVHAIAGCSQRRVSRRRRGARD